jgi:hypothetical protein
MKKRLASLLRLVLWLVPVVVLVAQANYNNVFTGTWKANVAQSHYSPGPPPKSTTLTFAPDGVCTLEVVDEKGKEYKYSMPWSTDGKEVPAPGMGEGTTISSKVQGHTMNVTMKAGGKIVQTIHAVASPDGRTHKGVIDAKDEQGHSVHDVVVFEKQ